MKYKGCSRGFTAVTILSAIALWGPTQEAQAQPIGTVATHHITKDYLSHSNNHLILSAGNTGDVVIDSQKLGAGAQNFIDNMARKGLGFLSNQSMSSEQKKKAFAKLLNDSFDMKTIGRFSLGRYWRVSTTAERNEYLDLFNDMVIEVYSDRFSEYSGQTFETVSYRQEGKRDTIVTSYITDNNAKVQVDWRVRYKDGRYKVVDVMVEGVSMSMTQRSDFSAVIQRGGGNVSVLLDHLRGQR